MKISISNETYMAIYSALKSENLLFAASSFTDMDGRSEYGDGKPRMETVWAVESAPILETIMTKENAQQENWDVSRYLHIATVIEKMF